MNPDLLLKHFEQISEAPDAVLRLRRFTLDLAVRGKLVEQDPNDEPASELLKRIEADSDQSSFEIPEKWLSARPFLLENGVTMVACRSGLAILASKRPPSSHFLNLQNILPT